MKTSILIHPDRGIFIGSCMGLGFWTLLETADQDSVVAFVDQDDINLFMAETGAPEVFEGCFTREISVESEDDLLDGGYLSFETLREKGLAEFLPPTTLH